jgi:hypothetical protein
MYALIHSRCLNRARIQFGFPFRSPWGAQGAPAQLAYHNSSFGGLFESSKPPTDRGLEPVADEKHHVEDQEEEGAHDISLSCGAEKGGMRAPHRVRVREE